MFFAGVIGVPGKIAPCTISGTLSQTAAPAGGIVTSNTRTITVPIGNSGEIAFDNFVFSGAVTTRYSKNGAAMAAIVDGGSVTFASGDTLAVEGSNMASGESWSFDLIDVTRLTTIGSYAIVAT